jgi:hypothetical protein
MGIEPFTCSTTQILNKSCILGVVVGDSLRKGRSQCKAAWLVERI